MRKINVQVELDIQMCKYAGVKMKKWKICVSTHPKISAHLHISISAHQQYVLSRFFYTDRS